MSRPFDPSAAALPESGLFGLTPEADEAFVHVVPVPFDATASYRRGAARAPQAILSASRQVELFDPVFGRPYELGIALEEPPGGVLSAAAEAGPLAEKVIERGGDVAGEPSLEMALARVNELSAAVDEAVRARTAALLRGGRLPIVLGGDHSVPLGAILAAAEHSGRLGLLHFDAHADLRVAFEGFTGSHASVLHNVLERADGIEQVVQVGVRDFCEAELEAIRSSQGRIRTVFDHEWARAKAKHADLVSLVRGHLAHLPREVWITFDVDGLDPALAPSTGTPVPGGLGWNEARLWLEELVRTGHVVLGADLCEVRPGATGPGDCDSWDAIVGARLLYSLIGCAVASRRGVQSPP